MPIFFFFNDTATTEIYTLSLHDALPISEHLVDRRVERRDDCGRQVGGADDSIPLHAVEALVTQLLERRHIDRKSTRLNSSHLVISYAVFCLKKKIQITWYNRFLACDAVF